MQRVRGTAVLSLEEFLPNERGYEIPLVDTLKDDGNDVTSEVESREVTGRLVGAVDALPPQERTVIRSTTSKARRSRKSRALWASRSRGSRRSTPRP